MRRKGLETGTRPSVPLLPSGTRASPVYAPNPPLFTVLPWSVRTPHPRPSLTPQTQGAYTEIQDERLYPCSVSGNTESKVQLLHP